MDTLALLCTLYADGPATLKRLRQVGCSTLEQLGSIELARLAELLGGSPAAARRFVREAKSLSERVGGGWLERDDSTARVLALSASEPQAVLVPPAEPGDHSALTLGDSALVERVLSVWRERDQVESPTPSGAPAQNAGVPVVSTAPHACGAVSKPPTAVGAVRALAPCVIDGLDATLCGRLDELGIRTLDELAHADVLALAGALNLGYTRVYRLQFLAARAPVERAAAAERRASEKLSPSEQPAQDWSLRIEFEPLLEVLPRSLLPALGRRTASADRPASVHATAAPREDAGGPFA